LGNLCKPGAESSQQRALKIEENVLKLLLFSSLSSCQELSTKAFQIHFCPISVKPHVAAGLKVKMNYFCPLPFFPNYNQG